MPDLRERLQTGLAGRYRIEREAGRGGMAVVFLAADLEHERLVAIKVLNPELGSTLSAERFHREVRVVARLRHPNILPLLDAGVAGMGSRTLTWFAMPFIQGQTLGERLANEDLPIAEALRIGRDAASALGYAHDHGVIHRDVKPDNILLSAEGQVLVADFGIALALRADESGGLATGEFKITATGVMVGTPAYVSPEQATGISVIDGRTDVYSLGAVVYEMLAGVAPFTGPNAQSVLIRAAKEPPRPIRTFKPAVPEAVERAVLKALSKAPPDRFATMAEFAGALGDGQHSILRRAAALFRRGS